MFSEHQSTMRKSRNIPENIGIKQTKRLQNGLVSITTKIILFLTIKIAQRAGGFKWIHGQCVMSYHRWYNVVGVGAIIANAVAVALNVPYVIVCQEAFNGLKIAAIIIASFVTIVMAFQQFKDFGGLRKEHITSEANYAALYDTIRNELQKEAKNREDANDYLKWITKQMTDLKSR